MNVNVTWHPADDPGGRPATEQEITDFLASMTALDGTNYVDIYQQTIEEGWE
ncbi:hypothetical protein [Kitasatospora kifunensis]|uniref:Uncharacterized protein n=1 Tax=Kitasatospora kifunensis TaxID=58351 RepID=A0A7W7QYU1_KITKI|nr:hypothetical protein [Kitasatospora kifunensis]MBB4922239.1 hypothetical protein [Kitasatospora kifunensis]